MKQFALPADKIIVNHWAPDGTCQRVIEARARYALRPGQRYVFGFGAADPRKNTLITVDMVSAAGSRQLALADRRAYA
jgi:hypothetical protein